MIKENKSYCICYSVPDDKNYFYHNDSMPIKKDDWIYAFIKYPHTKEGLLNYYIRLTGIQIIYITEIKQYELLHDVNIATFIADDSKLYYLLLLKDNKEILDPVTFVTYCKLLELDRVKNEKRIDRW